MNRDRVVGRVGLLNRVELITQASFHEAGHAAAIYFRNRHYNLPRISFRISLKGLKHTSLLGDHAGGFPMSTECHAKLEGGLLVESLGIIGTHAMPKTGWNYQQICTADLVNLMAGPLAEALHVAQRDGECINQHLVDYVSLKYYGGKADQDKIEQYLEQLGLSRAGKVEKLKALHSSAFHFVNQVQNWRAISRLANYIVNSDKEMIAYEDAANILESAMKTNYGIEGY